MKTSILLISICLLVLSCKQSNDTVDTNHVDFSISQYGSAVEPLNGTYYLQKDAFHLVFKFKKPNFILVNASHNQDLMVKALNNEELVTQPQFKQGNIIAETYFNTEKSIYTSNIASSAWLQESMQKHMFNSLEIKNGIYTATRVIENSFDLDDNYNTTIKNINKPLYLVFVVIDNNTDLKSNTELQRIAIKIDWLEGPEDAQESIENADISTYFHLLADNFALKNLPVSDDSNFNNTAITEVLDKEEANLLKLGKIYPNFFTAGYSFKVKPSHRLNIQENIRTLVLNVAKGEHELETILVNYDIDGNLIDYKIIAYDEIADGSHTISSTIEDNLITITHYWIDEEEDVTQRFKIETNGKIIPYDNLDVVLKQLNIKKEDVYEGFYTLEEITYKKSLMVIPKIAKQTDDELILDANILFVNTQTDSIEAKYTQKELWRGDAVHIISIEAHYNPYKITENTETVGVTVYYANKSHLNPYKSNVLTLFLRDEDSLKPILKDFEVYNKTERYEDDEGNGSYIESNKTITEVELEEEEKQPLNQYSILKINNKTEEAQYIFGEEQQSETHNKVEFYSYQNGTYVKDSIN